MEAGWVNGGYMVMEPGVFEYIDGDETPLPGTDAAIGQRRTVDLLSARRLLAERGYPAGQGPPRTALERRLTTLANLEAI